MHTDRQSNEAHTRMCCCGNSLELPGDVVQNGKEHAEFDRENNRLTVWIPKLTPGEHFDGLDMLTKLLTHRKELPATIEELDGDEQPPADESAADAAAAAAAADTLHVLRPHYGFADGFSDFFEPLQEDLPEIIDLPQPDLVAAADRTRLREQQEDQHFEIEHYMFATVPMCSPGGGKGDGGCDYTHAHTHRADFMEEEALQPYLDYEAPWEQELRTLERKLAAEAQPPTDAAEAAPDACPCDPAALVSMAAREGGVQDRAELARVVVAFTDEDNETLMTLPRRQCLHDPHSPSHSFSPLTDVASGGAHDGNDA